MCEERQSLQSIPQCQFRRITRKMPKPSVHGISRRVGSIMRLWRYSILLSCAGAIVAAGCSPEAYKHSADVQVERIVRGRERRTLDYTPEVEAVSTVPTEPPPAAYAKIPATTMPTEADAGESPIEPAPRELPLR